MIQPPLFQLRMIFIWGGPKKPASPGLLEPVHPQSGRGRHGGARGGHVLRPPRRVIEPSRRFLGGLGVPEMARSSATQKSDPPQKSVSLETHQKRCANSKKDPAKLWFSSRFPFKPPEKGGTNSARRPPPPHVKTGGPAEFWPDRAFVRRKPARGASEQALRLMDSSAAWHRRSLGMMGARRFWGIGLSQHGATVFLLGFPYTTKKGGTHQKDRPIWHGVDHNQGS